MCEEKTSHDGKKKTVERYRYDSRRDPRSTKIWAAKSSRRQKNSALSVVVWRARNWNRK